MSARRTTGMSRRLGVGVMIVAMAAGMSITSFAAQRRHPKRKPETALIKKLQREIMQRDALIRSLLSRVERIERHDGIRSAANRRRRSPRLASGPALSGETSAAASSEVAPPSEEAAAPTPGSAAPGAAAAPAPGQFTVSKQAAEHALERALVQSGALLLQPGKFQVVPSLTYQFQQATQPDRLALTTSGTVLVTQDLLRASTVQAESLFRAGLPWDSQLEIGIPYAYKTKSTTTRVLGSDLADKIVDAVGFGDPTIALTKQLTKESEWLPNLFLRGSWNIDLGQAEKGLPLGMGFNQISAGLLASKRQDPLVFTAGFTYLTNLEHHGITPGDQFTPSLGLLFAVSPETSLQFSQQASFIEDTRFRGANVPGSSSLQAAFTAGALSILAPGIVVQFLASIGETPDAPALTVQLAFPIDLN
jgi:hypothetical protein